MSKKKLCGLDYCPQEEMIGAYANCTACAWGNGSDSETAEEIKGIDDEDRLLKESDVIKAIDKRVEELKNDPEFVRKKGYIDVLGIKKYILTIPSANRPQGEWIGEADGYANGELVYDTWYCSNCDYAIDDDEPPAWDFCPMCGVRMSGAK